MNLAAFCSQLDELFELDAGTVKPTDSLQQLPGWDSITFMGLIAMVDDEYDVTLKPTAVLNAASVADVASLIGGDAVDHSAAA